MFALPVGGARRHNVPASRRRHELRRVLLPSVARGAPGGRCKVTPFTPLIVQLSTIKYSRDRRSSWNERERRRGQNGGEVGPQRSLPVRQRPKIQALLPGQGRARRVCSTPAAQQGSLPPRGIGSQALRPQAKAHCDAERWAEAIPLFRGIVRLNPTAPRRTTTSASHVWRCGRIGRGGRRACSGRWNCSPAIESALDPSCRRPSPAGARIRKRCSPIED